MMMIVVMMMKRRVRIMKLLSSDYSSKSFVKTLLTDVRKPSNVQKVENTEYVLQEREIDWPVTLRCFYS
jgi:hypothetical protein